MTREEGLDWLYRLRSEIYVYMPKECLIPMNNALDMAIKALEHPEKNVIAVVPCGDAISRADAIRVASGYCHPSNVAKELAQLPSVTPQETRKGHWISRETKGVRYAFWCRYKCSLCGELSDHTNFCPNCGAKMVEPQESEVEDGKID